MSVQFVSLSGVYKLESLHKTLDTFIIITQSLVLTFIKTNLDTNKMVNEWKHQSVTRDKFVLLSFW